jgi:PKD repeat protein
MWAPIMGVGYSKPMVQWSKGEYANASNKEDDLAVMQQFIALRADDAGNTPQTAALLQPAVTNGMAAAAAEGLIGRPGDRDLYMFTAGTGSMAATVSPAARSPNVDLTLSLLNDAGVVLASSNPLNALNASVTFTIPRAGTYYLQVGATGQGNPMTDGYSDYGSLGNYRLTASYTAAGGSPPAAALAVTPSSGPAPLTVRLDSRASRDDGEIRFVYWNFGDGTADNSGTLRLANKTYSRAGSYPVTIRVVDNTGLSATATQTVTVTAAAVNQPSLRATVSLASLNLSRSSWAAQGTLLVTDAAGSRLANAAVSYSWSGLQQGARNITSQMQGSPILSLASSQNGCFVLTVTGITLAGYSYNAAAPATARACR